MVTQINEQDVARSSTLTSSDVGMYAILLNGCYVAFFTDKADAVACEMCL